MPDSFQPVYQRVGNQMRLDRYDGVPVGLGCPLTGDPDADAIRISSLRATAWWLLECQRRGIPNNIGEDTIQ